MASFGQLLRLHRRQCHDPIRGGPLTQERLGELLGDALGGAGYSGAAVSEWERDKSKIDEDNRAVLVGLISTLQRYGGLGSTAEANELLQSGNYRALNAAELDQLPSGMPQDAAAEMAAGPVVVSSAGTSPSEPGRSITKARRKQLILLDKVKSFWITGVLEKSVPDAEISPHFRQAGQSVEHPWDQEIGADDLDHIIDSGQSPLDLFLNTGRSLLVLGEPGAGKTMLLLSLARALIRRAEADPAEPIPVILSLMSWAKQRLAIDTWVVEELAAKYMIPRRIGRQWLEDDDLILLLDGFDDVPARLRQRCAQALNLFRASYGLSGIIVCSRSEEYAATGIKLKFGAAIELLPLTGRQINDYLSAAGPRLAKLLAAVQRDTTLREMAANPLMLSIMSRAYDDVEPETTGAPAGPKSAVPVSLVTRRQRLFDTYVNRMFRRRAPDKHFSARQTVSRLSWLASQMYRFRQTPLLLEQIQPSWLPRQRWRRLYMLLAGLITGVFVAFIIWMLLQILRQTTPQLTTLTAQRVAALLGIGQGPADVVTLLALNIALGLVLAVLQGRYFEMVDALPDEPDTGSRAYRRHLVSVGLAIGLFTLLVGSLNGEPLFALAWATAETFVFTIAARYIFGRSYNNEIRTVEALGWSWPSAFRGFLIGLAAAAVFELMEYLLYDGRDVTLSIIIPAAGGAILGGLNGRRVEAKSTPNQGIHLSLRNSFVAATLSALILTMLAWYLRWPTYALYTGALVFVIAGALFGGGNVIKHYLVRLLLWLHKDLPWNAIGFLDYAADLVFLRKVGGGYIFIHQLLQQYFASLHRPHLESDVEADPARQAAGLEQAPG